MKAKAEHFKAQIKTPEDFIRLAASKSLLALICWFGFLFAQYAAIAVFSAFETNPWPLILINMGRPLLAFAISGIVLGAWRLREP